MTLQQLRYVIQAADSRSMNEAAKALYISQPSLSVAIKELEKEIGIELFKRSSHGTVLTPEGEEFLGYARQVTDQYQLLENRYIYRTKGKKKFSVSMQHYSFAVKAFVELVKRFGMDEYEFAVYETRTYDVLMDVKNFKSELGILYRKDFNAKVLNKLLKVLEDKRVKFESAYYDEEDPNVPKYIKKLFAEGAPADFILIGATTRSPWEINPAIRSRCAEIFFEPLVPSDIQTIVENAARELGAVLEDGAAALISTFTIEGRKAVNILADAYGLAVYRAGRKDGVVITKDHIHRVSQISRLTPYAMEKASDVPAVGKIFGLGVSGYLGSAIEIEAVAFPAREAGKGYYRFNDTAGSMAKDSMFNAAAVVRSVTGKELSDYDVNINFVGGGNIDGPSAGCAITTALISAITQTPIRQDVAVTGEISVRGQVKPVGGVFEKAYGACQAGMKAIVIPKDNGQDIPEHHLDLDIRCAETIQDVLDVMFVK